MFDPTARQFKRTDSICHLLLLLSSIKHHVLVTLIRHLGIHLLLQKELEGGQLYWKQKGGLCFYVKAAQR